MTDEQARNQVAGTFPSICGACFVADMPTRRPTKTPTRLPTNIPTSRSTKKPTRLPTSRPTLPPQPLTCSDVWDSPATDSIGTFSCGNRIMWLRSFDGGGKTEEQAKIQVAMEFPSICGPCGAIAPTPAPMPTSTGESSLTVVTQNLFWWNLFGQRGGGNFFNVFPSFGPYDIFLFQECDSVEHIRNGLGYPNMQAYQGGHGVAIMWDSSRFHELDRGWDNVGEDRSEQYYGFRGVTWVRLHDNISGKNIFAASHHGPLPINTGGATGGPAVANSITDLINEHKADSDAVILGGDLNAEVASETVLALKSNGLKLHASDWVDHILTSGLSLDHNPEITVLYNTGSDHRGIKATWSSF